jgi:signal transduction histidine kinase
LNIRERFASLKKELPDFKFKFDNETETAFRSDYLEKSLVAIRAGYFLCIVLYAVFGFLDIWIVPETKYIAWFIRFVIVIPILFLIIIISFTDFFKRYNQILLSISSSIAGLGIVMMIAHSHPSELGYKFYYSGLVLVIIWIYTFIRLRFWNGIISALIITAGYELVAVFIQHLTAGGLSDENMLVFINNNFFFISANIIGLWASYHIEKLHRSDFIQKQIIKNENIRITNFSNQLHLKNEEIIAQGFEIEVQHNRLAEQNSLLETQTQAILLQNKELQEINATKDKFFSIIAHDLKNPFNSIISFSNLLVLGLPSLDRERLHKFAANINDSAQDTYKLLENLLEWARSQTGRIEFKQEKTDLKNIFDLACGNTHSMAANKNISLNCELTEHINVFVDKNMINTVLRNLISNAVKYSYNGGAIKILTVLKVGEVEISVVDNGVGLEQEQIKKLFKISEKVSTSGTEKETGTGLGLLLCKEFVEKHGGKIWVESEFEKGSSFRFTLPLCNEPSI